MQEIQANIWTFHDAGAWIIITTNGDVRKDGLAVMGRGTALQASQRFVTLQSELGSLIKTRGNIPFFFRNYHLITLPVKHHWQDKADVKLIISSIEQMIARINEYNKPFETRHGGELWGGKLSELIYPPIFGTRFGCGNGKLDWKTVKPIIEPLLDKRFIICQMNLY